MKSSDKKWALLLLGLWWLGKKERAKRTTPATSSARKPVPEPVTVPATPVEPIRAHLYKNPDDAFDTVRMSVDFDRTGTFKEMGIFSSKGKALAQAKQSGWVVDEVPNGP